MADTVHPNNRQRYDSASSDAAALERRIETPQLAHNTKSRGPSVLVVDGAEPACRLLRLARDQIAHRCLIIYVQQRPSCVVLDLDRYGNAALEVCRTICGQQDAGDTTILLLTAKRSVEAFDAALLAGADDILLKPVTDAELLERVEDALRPVRATSAELRRRCERLCQLRARLQANTARCTSIAG